MLKCATFATSIEASTALCCACSWDDDKISRSLDSCGTMKVLRGV